MEILDYAADLTTREVLFVVGVPFVALGVSAAVYGVVGHLRDYVKPNLQRYEVRILLMIPIYIVLTWLPLYYPRATRYYRMGRDFFQGFFVASFFQLLVEYLGGEDRTVALLGNKEPIDNGKCCWCGPAKAPTTFDNPVKNYLKLKRGAMQFTIVMPLIALITMLLDFYNLYNSGEFDPAKSFVWLQVIRLVSALWSMFSLKDFLAIMSPELEALKIQPNQKMLCIQGVILGLLVQGIIISILFSAFGWATRELNSEDVNNFIAVCEMTFVAFAHSAFFSYHEFEDTQDQQPRRLQLSRAATDSLIPTDYVRDLTYVFSKAPQKKFQQIGSSTALLDDEQKGGKEIPRVDEEEETRYQRI